MKDLSETTLGNWISKLGTVHRAIVMLDDVDAIKEHGFDRILP